MRTARPPARDMSIRRRRVAVKDVVTGGPMFAADIRAVSDAGHPQVLAMTVCGDMAASSATAWGHEWRHHSHGKIAPLHHAGIGGLIGALRMKGPIRQFGGTAGILGERVAGRRGAKAGKGRLTSRWGALVCRLQDGG